MTERGKVSGAQSSPSAAQEDSSPTLHIPSPQQSCVQLDTSPTSHTPFPQTSICIGHVKSPVGEFVGLNVIVVGIEVGLLVLLGEGVGLIVGVVIVGESDGFRVGDMVFSFGVGE